MPKYRFTVTREITESAVVEIEAADIIDAHEKGLQKANAFEVTGWQTDDQVSGQAYLPDPEDYTVVSKAPVVTAGVPLCRKSECTKCGKRMTTNVLYTISHSGAPEVQHEVNVGKWTGCYGSGGGMEIRCLNEKMLYLFPHEILKLVKYKEG